MDFRLTRTLAILLAGTAGSLLMTGCSSSMGYVDYASIPAPAEAQEQDVNTDTRSNGTVETTTVADSTPEQQPEDAGASADGQTPKTPHTEGTGSQDPENGSQDNAGESPDVGDAEALATEALATETPATETQATNKPVPADGTGLPTDAANRDSVQPAADVIGSSSGNEQTAVEPLEMKLLIPDKRFRAEGDAAALRLSYDDIDLLKVLNMQPVPTDAPKHFPAWLAELDGKRIRIRGFMYPTFEAEGIDYFRLARDNGICCFVKQPKIYDIIDVIMADGETTDYIENKPFDVEGVFRIDPDADETELFQLYRIEDAIVLR